MTDNNTTSDCTATTATTTTTTTATKPIPVENLFDPTSTEYRIDGSGYLPTKECTWKYPPNCDGWYHTNNAFRGEVQAIRTALEATVQRYCGSEGTTTSTTTTVLQKWEIDSIVTVVNIHYDHMENNNTIQNNLFEPEFKKRFQSPKQFVIEYEFVQSKMNQIKEILATIQQEQQQQQHQPPPPNDTTGSTASTVTIDSIRKLGQVWVEYEIVLRHQLQTMESMGIPLMRVYFTPKEMAPIVQKLVKQSTKMNLGSFFYYIGKERLQNEFMKQESIPWFVYHVDFQWKIQYFEKMFLSHIDALITGR